jgi:hypothetical protein
MQRRPWLALALLVTAVPVLAHHGWGSFDQNAPVYIEGRVKSVEWRNPHAEAVVEVGAALILPADLAQRKLPAQSQAVDGAAIAAKARVPNSPAGDWEIEFAPLSRMEAWGVAPLKAGDRIGLIGYTGVPGKPRLMRVEYLFVDGKAYGLRSSPVR